MGHEGDPCRERAIHSATLTARRRRHLNTTTGHHGNATPPNMASAPRPADVTSAGIQAPPPRGAGRSSHGAVPRRAVRGAAAAPRVARLPGGAGTAARARAATRRQPRASARRPATAQRAAPAARTGVGAPPAAPAGEGRGGGSGLCVVSGSRLRSEPRAAPADRPAPPRCSQVKCVEVVETYIERIREVNPLINAVVKDR